MGYFKEKDIEQKELLEKAMKIVDNMSTISYYINEVEKGLMYPERGGREAALIRLGKLSKIVERLVPDVNKVQSAYNKMNKWDDFDYAWSDRYKCMKLPTNVERIREWANSPHHYEDISKRWDDFMDNVKINTKPYPNPIDKADVDKNLNVPDKKDEPKKGTPAPKKRGRPKKVKK